MNLVSENCVYPVWVKDLLTHINTDDDEAKKLKNGLVTLFQNMDCQQHTNPIWRSLISCLETGDYLNFFNNMMKAVDKGGASFFMELWNLLSDKNLKKILQDLLSFIGKNEDDQDVINILNELAKNLNGKIVPRLCAKSGLTITDACNDPSTGTSLKCLAINISNKGDNTTTIDENGAIYTPLLKSCDDSLEITKACAKVKLSTDYGQQLQLRENGLFYGIVAPADIANLYCNINGDDENEGTEEKPLKSLDGALKKIADRNVGGSYTIYLQAGQTFKQSKGFYFSAFGTSINIQYYGDPNYGQYLGVNNYQPVYSDTIVRPTMIWDTYTDDNSFVQAGGISGGSGFQLFMRGIIHRVRNSAGVTSGGGWFTYISLIAYHGCDVYVEGQYLGIGSATNVILFKNNFYKTYDDNHYFISDNTPQFFINDSGLTGTVSQDPFGKYPPVTIRSQNQYEAFKVNDICALTEWDTETKTFFGAGFNWDIFKHS